MRVDANQHLSLDTPMISLPASSLGSSLLNCARGESIPIFQFLIIPRQAAFIVFVRTKLVRSRCTTNHDVKMISSIEGTLKLINTLDWKLVKLTLSQFASRIFLFFSFSFYSTQTRLYYIRTDRTQTASNVCFYLWTINPHFLSSFWTR